MSEVKCILESNDIVGEGVFWDEKKKRILWVDIIGKKIKELDWESKAVKTWDTDDFPTAVIPIVTSEELSQWIVPFAGGIYIFDSTNNEKKFFSHPEKDFPENRLNEAKCDPMGRLWIGTMYNNINPDGSGKDIIKNSGGLFRVNSDGSFKQFGEKNFGIGNTMAWDLKRSKFYFADTLAHSIYVYDYDSQTGELSNQKLFAQTKDYGMPDGSCIDSEGNLWNARFGGGCVIRYNPNGKIDDIIKMPAKNITSCTFGGENNQNLIVTSAQFLLDEKEVIANPQEGGLFSLETDYQGDNYYFAGN